MTPRKSSSAALRMSASFPYITPPWSLPSHPPIEIIMDAGISDNFGVGDASRFIYVFRKWLEENTSGITLLIIRDTRKNAPIEPRTNSSLVGQADLLPLPVFTNNLGNIQDINNESKIEGLSTWLHLPARCGGDRVQRLYETLVRQYLVTSKELERKQAGKGLAELAFDHQREAEHHSKHRATQQSEGIDEAQGNTHRVMVYFIWIDFTIS